MLHSEHMRQSRNRNYAQARTGTSLSATRRNHTSVVPPGFSRETSDYNTLGSSQEKSWDKEKHKATIIEKGKTQRPPKSHSRTGCKNYMEKEAEQRLQNEEQILDQVNAKEAESCYFKYLPLIRKIAYSTLRRFRPRNASASSSIFADQKDIDPFTLKSHDWRDEEYTDNPGTEDRSSASRRRRNNSSLVTDSELISPIKCKYPVNVISINTISSPSSLRVASIRKADHTPYLNNSTIIDDSMYMRGRKRRVLSSAKRPTFIRKRDRYRSNLENLITKCKEVELQMDTRKLNEYSQRVQQDKGTKRVGWALKEYLASINSADWSNAKSIDFLMNIKDSQKISKKTLFDDELINKVKSNIARRSLFISSLGKKKIWKPQKYVPSRQVVLANSIEELNNLYKVDGDPK